MAVNDLIAAANGGVPATNLKPQNCHEAALGWVLMAKYPQFRAASPQSGGVPDAWFRLRTIALAYGGNDPKQLTGQWIGTNIYRGGKTRITNQNVLELQVGDLLIMGNPAAPHHSMVIVQAGQILARGFNNAGAFGGPFMDWDPQTQRIDDVVRWDANGNFKANNGPAEINAMRYDAVCANIPDNLVF